MDIDDLPEDVELKMVTAMNPLLILVVTVKDDEVDVMIDGVLPEVLRAGALRAIAADLDGVRTETALQN